MGWARLFPELTITGLEQSGEAHAAAAQAASRLLDNSMRQRVNFFHCDPLATATDLSEANIVLVNASGYDDVATVRLHASAQSMSVSARIVLLSHEGPRDVSSGLALFRFVLTHQAYYRTHAGGNVKAQVFLKI
jgi:hypothetical protein